MTLSAVGNDDRMLLSKFFCCLQMTEGRDTIKFQIPGPQDKSCIKCPGFAGGMLAAGIDSHIISMDAAFIRGRRLIENKVKICITIKTIFVFIGAFIIAFLHNFCFFVLSLTYFYFFNIFIIFYIYFLFYDMIPSDDPIR